MLDYFQATTEMRIILSKSCKTRKKFLVVLCMSGRKSNLTSFKDLMENVNQEHINQDMLPRHFNI